MISHAITITVSGASATAKAAVEQAGGSVTTTVAPKAAPAAAA
jgi:large subunit ribosomal protein L15